jgi:DNA replication protein DnaC
VEAAIDGGIELFGICDHNYGIGFGTWEAYEAPIDVVPNGYDPSILSNYYDEIGKIKEAAQGAKMADDSENLRQILDKYKTAEVLYIDDLFKTGKSQDNSNPKPTAADINYAFEIINYRYNNPSLLTIISSELSEDELIDIDEALGGRIYERAKAITIAKDRRRNYRIRKAVTL